MKILHVASEMFPWIKTGGLADVMAALPFAQKKLGLDVRVLLPGYPEVLSALSSSVAITAIDTFAGAVTLRYGEHDGLGIYVIDAPHLFDRPGNPYHDEHYQDYGDNFLRFALLSYIAAEMTTQLDSWWVPTIVHAHDWHTGLTCAYIKQKHVAVKTIFTIHNIAYQGLFAAHHLDEIGLPNEYFNIEGLEFHGQLSYLKSGIYFAHHVTTVSPTFAKEITTEAMGFGLYGLLQRRQQQGQLSGILNGVDDLIWNPACDEQLRYPYKIGQMQGKIKLKKQLQQAFKLPTDKQTPLFVVVSRLTEQKGIDLLINNIETISKHHGQIIVLGNGSPDYEQQLNTLADKHPESVAVFIGYNEHLAHQVIAGGDVIIVPSRFEPCGLTQLYGLKYGTLPLVRKTGGLADTVNHVDKTTLQSRQATGFVFHEATTDALQAAIESVIALWQKPRDWYLVRANAMRQDFSWQLAAKQYLDLYHQ